MTGQATRRTYNPNGQQKGIHSPYFSQTLEYNARGEVTSISNEGSYEYDELSQITLDRSTYTYDYDRHYNRIEKNGVASEYNSLDELISPNVIYDLNGNLRLKGEFEYTYDALNRLIKANSGQVHLTFTYDPLNRRITKASNGSTEFYLYNGTEELGSFDTKGATKDLKIPGLYGRPIALELQGHVNAPLLDHRGNIRRLVDVNTANITEHFDYTAFGEELTVNPSTPNPWRYSSKRYDRETGFYYFGHRFYDPETARWLSVDPAGFIDGTNLYAYVLNNPLNAIDPDGRFVFELISFSWGAGLAMTPIGWATIGLCAVGTVTVWGVQKLYENGTIKTGTGTDRITTGFIQSL